MILLNNKFEIDEIVLFVFDEIRLWPDPRAGQIISVKPRVITGDKQEIDYELKYYGNNGLTTTTVKEKHIFATGEDFLSAIDAEYQKIKDQKIEYLTKLLARKEDKKK